MNSSFLSTLKRRTERNHLLLVWICLLAFAIFITLLDLVARSDCGTDGFDCQVSHDKTGRFYWFAVLAGCTLVGFKSKSIVARWRQQHSEKNLLASLAFEERRKSKLSRRRASSTSSNRSNNSSCHGSPSSKLSRKSSMSTTLEVSPSHHRHRTNSPALPTHTTCTSNSVATLTSLPPLSNSTSFSQHKKPSFRRLNSADAVDLSVSPSSQSSKKSKSRQRKMSDQTHTVKKLPIVETTLDFDFEKLLAEEKLALGGHRSFASMDVAV